LSLQSCSTKTQNTNLTADQIIQEKQDQYHKEQVVNKKDQEHSYEENSTNPILNAVKEVAIVLAVIVIGAGIIYYKIKECGLDEKLGIKM
jgi:hypothetical protein